MAEEDYKAILDGYLEKRIEVNDFVNSFMNQWRIDRDANTLFDNKFQRLIDRLFTSCDCYSEKPEHQIEISENELRNEVDLLRHIWFG